MDTPHEGYAQPRFAASVKRYCQTLDLRDDPRLVERYRHLHSPEGIWPEIPAGIRAVGILRMEIYLVDTRLFMIVDTPLDFDWDEAMARLDTLPRQREWEAFVAAFQAAAPGASSAQKWRLMERIFRLD